MANTRAPAKIAITFRFSLARALRGPDGVGATTVIEARGGLADELPSET
jgi:hypothetical protein